ncbi:MAG: IPT/TIG domain-containing protein [Planctomycetes bacterium]|nr:IPT/TIG domain-containing protein [Planctomycetota bacterium]
MKTSSSASSASSASRQRSLKKTVRTGTVYLALALASWFVGAGIVEAYVRIQLGGKTLYHDDPNIVMQLDPNSFSGLDGEAVRSAVQLSMAQWNSVPRSALNFTLGVDVSGADYTGNNHVIYYDPNNNSGWFGGGSMTVAVTPIQYSTGNGKIQDIDVIFNGRRWDFSTGIVPGDFDIQDVLTHELGHVAGLDHSPVHGSSMWPYVAPGQWLHRSITEDDRSGAVAVARQGGFAQMRGTLRRANSNPVGGGAVGAIRADDGRLAAVVLTASNGDWVIKDLPSGDYHLYTTPLEGVTSQSQLTGDGIVETDFGAAFHGGISSPHQITLSQGENLNVGNLVVAADAAVRDNFNHPLILARGGPTKSIYIPGVNFNGGVGSMIEFSPYITLGPLTSDNTLFSAPVTVAPNCPPGSYDIYISLANGELECVPGAIEVVEAAPELSGISATEANALGGEWIEVYGSDFAEDAMVLVGGRLSNDVRWQNANTLRVLTPKGDSGEADVVVQHPDGQEDRLEDVLRYITVPVYEELFPRAGNLGGGTRMRLVGSGFSGGMIVQVGGKSASYRLLSTRVIEITTPPGDMLGTVSVRIENSEGHVEEQSDVFEYVASEDPDIASFTPRTGKRSGGTEVNLFGDNLASGARVRFGVDPITVQGGRYAGGVQRISAAELRSRTPGGSTGEFAVVVEMPNGQGAIANSFFSYQPAAGGGGCGGVAQGGAPGEPVDWLPIVLVAVWGWRISRRQSSETKSGCAR